MRRIYRNIIVSAFLSLTLISVILLSILLPRSFDVKILIICSDEDFIEYGFPGSGTKNDPYLIQNLELGLTKYYVDDYYTIISISNTTKYFVIRNCVLSGGIKSIHLNHVENRTAKIIGNTLIAWEFCVDNIYFETSVGIEVENTAGVEIRDNILIGREIVKTWSLGEYILYNEFTRGVCLKNSSNNLIESNNIKNTEIPIDCFKSDEINVERNLIIFEEHAGCWFINCSSVSISDNMFKGYVFDSIYVSYSVNVVICNNTIIMGGYSTGIRLNYSKYMFIDNNSISNNNVGIRITYCSEILISLNVINRCYYYAIDLFFDISQVVIYHNSFLNNNFKNSEESQCRDNGINNIWYNEYINEGNYWSDLGMNLTYEIDGSAGSVDFYPLPCSL